jgi:hypothetical protein
MSNLFQFKTVFNLNSRCSRCLGGEYFLLPLILKQLIMFLYSYKIYFNLN